MYAAVIEVTPENQDALVTLVSSMYLGEKCKFCGRQYTTLNDLKDVVWTGNDGLACKRCWEEDVAYKRSLDDATMQEIHELGQ